MRGGGRAETTSEPARASAGAPTRTTPSESNRAHAICDAWRLSSLVREVNRADLSSPLLPNLHGSRRTHRSANPPAASGAREDRFFRGRIASTSAPRRSGIVADVLRCATSPHRRTSRVRSRRDPWGHTGSPDARYRGVGDERNIGRRAAQTSPECLDRTSGIGQEHRYRADEARPSDDRSRESPKLSGDVAHHIERIGDTMMTRWGRPGRSLRGRSSQPRWF